MNRSYIVLQSVFGVVYESKFYMLRTEAVAFQKWIEHLLWPPWPALGTVELGITSRYVLKYRGFK